MTPPPRVPDGLHVASRECIYCGARIHYRATACRDHVALLALDPNAERWRKRPRLGTHEGQA